MKKYYPFILVALVGAAFIYMRRRRAGKVAVANVTGTKTGEPLVIVKNK